MSHIRDIPNVDGTCEFCGEEYSANVEHACPYFGPNLAETLRTLEAAVTALTARVDALENP